MLHPASCVVIARSLWIGLSW